MTEFRLPDGTKLTSTRQRDGRVRGVDSETHRTVEYFGDENGGKAGRSCKTRQPRQPLVAGWNVFVLLAVCAGNHESGQLPPQQFLAKSGQPGGQRKMFQGMEIRIVA